MADLRLERDFGVTPARLFEVITTHALVVQWWGHDGMDLPDTHLDFSRTGPWHAVMVTGDGTRLKMSGQVTHVTPPVSVGFTWGWHDPQGQRGAETHVTFTVQPIAQGARLIIDHRDFVTDDIAAQHTRGWAGPLDRLARFLKAENKTA